MKNPSPSKSALINAYLDGNLGGHETDDVERWIAVDAEAAELLRMKQGQREELARLIPKFVPGKDTVNGLKEEMRQIESDLFPDSKASLVSSALKKTAKVLDTTILEF